MTELAAAGTARTDHQDASGDPALSSFVPTPEPDTLLSLRRLLRRWLAESGADVRRPDRGRGVALMRALTDEAEVGLGGPVGGVVRLRRRLARASGLPA